MIAEAVPDPELVVVTVGDLGIVRDIRTDAAGVEIDVTPTYSACPATLAIELAIETAVAAAGHEVRVRRVLEPAWTTDWITAQGRAKLKAAGIAPPAPRSQQDDGGYFARPEVACPRCDSVDTVELAPLRRDSLQGAVPLPQLPRTLRLFQMSIGQMPVGQTLPGQMPPGQTVLNGQVAG